MKKKIVSWLLLGIILSPFSIVAFANDIEKETTENSASVTPKNSQEVQTTENSQDAKMESSENSTNITEDTETTYSNEGNTDTTESKKNETSESEKQANIQSSEEEPNELLEDDEYWYPSNRSDLDLPTENTQNKIESRTLNQNLSITNSNLPKSNFIDISSHNGYISVDSFKTMKKYGVTGVVVKLTEGTGYRNPYARKQVANAKSAGLVVSVYHFSRFATAQKAREEANYFSAMARELGLPKTTVMVNDLESPELKWLNNNTDNAVAFANQLKANGYSTVKHYLGLHWINENRISPSRLGYSNIWVAAYPKNLTKTQQHTQFGAWQWSDQMTFPGVSGKFDISSDYNKVYSTPAEGKYIPDGRYVYITSKGYNVWHNFNFNSSNLKTDSIYQKTYLAKGRYEHSNGSTYYSLYKADGTWVGYLNSSATKKAPDKNGPYFSDGRYVTVNKRGYDAWNGFDWVTRNTSDKIYQKTYLAKGRYENANGSTYLSLYDDKDKWWGYINAKAVDFASGPQGIYMKQNSYASISSKTGNLFNNFKGAVRSDTKSIYQNNYNLTASYHHIDGTVYYSLYDDSNKWIGYAKSGDVKITNEANGPYIPYGEYVEVISKNYPIWRNFSWVKLSDASNYYGQTVVAKGMYKHTNGGVYYSLYDDNNTWLGYINSKAVKVIKQDN